MTLSKIKKVGVFSNSADSEEIVARAKHVNPTSGEKIQGGTANANISLAAYSVFLCGYKASGDWYGTEITAGAVA